MTQLSILLGAFSSVKLQGMFTKRCIYIYGTLSRLSGWECFWIDVPLPSPWSYDSDIKQMDEPQPAQ